MSMKFTDGEIKYLENYAEEYPDTVRVYEGYSGRGMFGSETDGLVVCSPADLARLVRQICDDREYLEDQPDENVDVESFLDKICNLHRQDTMGYDTILY